MNLDFVWDQMITGSGAGTEETQKEFSPKQISILKYQFISGGIGFGFKSRRIIFDENVNSAVHIESMMNTEFVGLANAMFDECHWHLV
jgi:hypothetical protein